MLNLVVSFGFFVPKISRSNYAFIRNTHSVSSALARATLPSVGELVIAEVEDVVGSINDASPSFTLRVI